MIHSHDFSIKSKNYNVRRLYKYLRFSKIDNKLKSLNIISLVRNPLNRNVSAFFQNFQKITGVSYKNSNFSIEDLEKIFLDKFSHEIPLEWFDHNILKNFSIDVFDKPFPENGICTYTKGIRLLVMRCEMCDDKKEKTIKKFLGLKDFKITRYNISENKDYGNSYEEFKKKIKLPYIYVSKMHDSRYFEHFYCKTTINDSKQMD